MTVIARTVVLTAAERFWYVLGCIGFGAMYFAKVPVKKALSEVGAAQMTGAEQFWYVLQCVFFGAGYFAKVPVKKALSEAPGLRGYDTGSPPDGQHQLRRGDEPQEWRGQEAQPFTAPLPVRHRARHIADDDPAR
jgi:hypothetical protein